MESDLVYDVGVHTGDTGYYLHKGSRVVGVEANRAMYNALRQRFSVAIASEQPVQVRVSSRSQPLLLRSAVGGVACPGPQANQECQGKIDIEGSDRRGARYHAVTRGVLSKRAR